MIHEDLPMEEPLNYEECSREKLLEVIQNRDKYVIEISKQYLEQSNLIVRLTETLMSESLKSSQVFQTEKMLADAGTPSADATKNIDIEYGKIEGFKIALKILAPEFFV